MYVDLHLAFLLKMLALLKQLAFLLYSVVLKIYAGHMYNQLERNFKKFQLLNKKLTVLVFFFQIGTLQKSICMQTVCA